LCVGFGFFIFPIAKQLLGQVPEETAHLARYLVFLGNFDTIGNGVLPDSSVLGILWSIAIEEQFYLTIPFILVLLPTRFYGWLFTCVIIASLVFRAIYTDNYLVIKFHTISYVGNLAIGGLIAYYSATSDRFLSFFSTLDRRSIGVGYIVLLILLIFRNDIFDNDVLRIFEAVAFSIMFAFVILEQNFAKGSLFKMRNNRVFSKLGTYTYGLYCLHLIAFLIVLQITGRMGANTTIWYVVFLETPLALLTSIAIAYTSYRFFERPFMLLKNRFASIAARPSKEPI
jgi:peptidoglycan/LPS O-acetylase OafA/YrhL